MMKIEVAPTCVGSRHHRRLSVQPHAADLWIPPRSPLKVHDTGQYSCAKHPDGVIKDICPVHFTRSVTVRLLRWIVGPNWGGTRSPPHGRNYVSEAHQGSLEWSRKNINPQRKSSEFHPPVAVNDFECGLFKKINFWCKTSRWEINKFIWPSTKKREKWRNYS